MRRISTRWSLFAVLLGLTCGLGAVPPAAAQSRAGSRASPRRVRLTLEDADLATTLRAISELTGKRFFFSGTLPAIHVTILTPVPVTVGEAFDAVIAALYSNGLAVVQRGGFYAVVSASGIVGDPVPVYGP